MSHEPQTRAPADDLDLEMERFQEWSQPRSQHVGVFASARRHPILALLPVLLFLAGAAYLGLTREPTYTATADLQVGRLNASEAGAVSGFASATQALAIAYSRAASGDVVVAPVARSLGVATRDLQNRVAASPVEGSPVFRVSVNGPSPLEAIRAANGVAASVVDYVDSLADDDKRVRGLYSEYLRLQRRISRDTVRQNRIFRRVQEAREADRDAGRDEDVLTRLRARIEGDRLRAQTLAENYRQARALQTGTEMTQILRQATSATSDRFDFLQLLGFLALLAGGALGLGLATLVANRRRT